MPESNLKPNSLFDSLSTVFTQYPTFPTFPTFLTSPKMEVGFRNETQQPKILVMLGFTPFNPTYTYFYFLRVIEEGYARKVIEVFKNYIAIVEFPRKSPHGGKLISEDKKSNQKLAKIKVLGEYVHRKLSLRFNLIVALYNYELHLLQTEFA